MKFTTLALVVLTVTLQCKVTLGHFQADPLVPTLVTPNDAVALVFPDFLALDAASQKYCRYIFVPDGTPKQASALALAVNLISRNSTTYKPAIIVGKKATIVRIDLRRMAEDEHDGLTRYLRTWEQMNSDLWFRFNPFGPGLTAEKEIKKTSKPTGKIIKCKTCKGFGRFNDGTRCKECEGTGKLEEFEEIEEIIEKAIKNTFKPGLHAGGAGPALLMADMAGSDAVIVHGGFFCIRALASIDIGFGKGLYQEFLGIKGKTHKEVLELVGASEIDAAKFSSDQRLVQISNVTGRARVAVFVRAIGGASVSRSMGVVMWTEDPSRKNYGTEHDAFLNLLNPKFDAIELFAPLPNGLMFSALFGADGQPQDFAPPDVVADRRVPEPNTTELQAGIISCGRCHGQATYGMNKEASFFQPLTNEVRDLLTLIEPNADFSALNLTREEFLKRVAGLYEWEPELDVLPLSRIFYSRAVAQCTDFGAGPLTVKEAWTEIAQLNDHYGYARVDAEEALRQLGYATPEDADAIDMIFQVIATEDELPPGIVFDFSQLKRADPTLGLLKIKDQFSGENRKITAVQWAQVYAHAAYKSIIRQPTTILRGDKGGIRKGMAP